MLLQYNCNHAIALKKRNRVIVKFKCRKQRQNVLFNRKKLTDKSSDLTQLPFLPDSCNTNNKNDNLNINIWMSENIRQKRLKILGYFDAYICHHYQPKISRLQIYDEKYMHQNIPRFLVFFCLIFSDIKMLIFALSFLLFVTQLRFSGKFFISGSMSDGNPQLACKCRQLKSAGKIPSTCFFKNTVNLKLTDNGFTHKIFHIADIGNILWIDNLEENVNNYFF